jgi:truncated hemoglobin YjbI
MEFDVSKEAAVRWLYHMECAFDATPQIDSDSRMRMMNFLKHTAYFLVVGVTHSKSQQK